VYDGVYRALRHELAFAQKKAGLAESANSAHVVTDENHGAPSSRHFAHLAQTFLLKISIADGEHLVNEKNLGLHMSGDGEGQAHIHAATVSLDWSINEFLNLGEGNNFVEPSFNLNLPHSKNRAIEIDVLAPRQ